jgi:aminomethyltransferase
VSALKQTPLYQLHLQYAAKMTTFAGYQMPLQYANGIIHEHLHCRAHAGFFDISHMGQAHILGDRAAENLEKLTPGGIIDLKVGQQKYTVLTNPEGGIIDDLIVTRLESGLGLIVNASCKEKDFAHLRRHLSADCMLHELTDAALFALQGPEAAVVMGKYSPTATELAFMQSCSTSINNLACTVSRSGYCGEDGFEISVPQGAAEQLALCLLGEQGVEPIGLGARNTLRLEAGLCLYGHELNETITPVEAGLHWLIKTGHTDFLGAEKILPQLHKGVEMVRVGLLVEGRIPVREAGQIYAAENDPIGYVTSGSFSPVLKTPIAMAMIKREFARPGTALSAVVRDSRISLQVCRLPFVPHHYHN